MLEINVTIRGPLFDKKVDQTVKRAILEEALHKMGPRMQRGGKGLGSRRNTVTTSISGLVLTGSSTREFPRTRGTAWQNKNVAILNKMAPNVLRSVSRRIVSELG